MRVHPTIPLSGVLNEDTQNELLKVHLPNVYLRKVHLRNVLLLKVLLAIVRGHLSKVLLRNVHLRIVHLRNVCTPTLHLRGNMEFKQVA